MVRFSAKPKNEPHSSLLRERSARKTSVFNQKTMFLGYAHSSYIHMMNQNSTLARIKNHINF
ncbi:MAG: hypothetical protein U5L45_11040 [Saprospiraceae bacterium]|nr:hypothetical protein [Saprospiraceae bacterium]